MKIYNPVINAIPEGQKVTVIMSSGERFTGTDDTTKEEAEKGLFVLHAAVTEHDLRESGGKANRKTYLLAAHVVGFNMFYDA